MYFEMNDTKIFHSKPCPLIWQISSPGYIYYMIMMPNSYMYLWWSSHHHHHQPETPFPPSLFSLFLSLSQKITHNLVQLHYRLQRASHVCHFLLFFHFSLPCVLFSLLFSILPYIYPFCGSTKRRGKSSFHFCYHFLSQSLANHY